MLAMTFDCHTHIFGAEITQNRDRYCASDACFGMLYSNSKARLMSAEDLIHAMDDRQISRSAVLNIGWESHDTCVRTNDYILESIARYPDRLIGFCSIQPKETEKALAEIDRCRLAGAAGIGELRPDVQGYGLDELSLMGTIAARLKEHGMTLLLHASEPVGHAYTGKGSVLPQYLYKFVEQNPGLKVVLAHFGGGLAFYELMPEVARTLANTFYDTAAAPFLYSPQIYTALLPVIGSGRLLFGSDWPLLDQVRVLDHVRSAGLSPKDLDNVLRANAERLFGVAKGTG